MNFIKNFLKGMIISISQIVPGVSGGTIAMVLGIYDKLIHAVNNILKDFKNNYKILFQVGVGAIVGIFLFSNIIKSLLYTYPIPLGYLFIGIILGGAPLMYKKATVTGFTNRSILYLFLGIVLVLIMTNFNNNSSSIIIKSLSFINFIWLFLGGIVIAIALILPGISGSFMLYILGLYNTVIISIAEVNIKILIPIALGIIIGSLLTSRVIEILLIKFPESTYMLILGFILGSVFSIFPGVDGINSIVGIILGVIGFISTYYICRNE